MPKNVLLLCPDPSDATSFYRGYGPWGALRKSHDINIIPGAGLSITWATLTMVDTVMLQRPFTNGHLTIARMCAERGIPFITDMDDDLFSVPEENPTFEMYSNPNNQKNIREILKLATVCIVSTAHLKKRLIEESKCEESKFVIIPNAFNDFHFKRKEKKKSEANKLVFWRGSKTHDKDLANYAQEIVKCSRKHPDYTFAFLGSNPWFIKQGMNPKQYVNYPAVDVYDYFLSCEKLYPLVTHVPLYENTFNKSKSNISWIEGSFFGSACVVPNWEEWQKPGVVTYSNQKEYEEGITNLIAHPDVAYDMNRISWEEICDTLLLSKVNESRWEILKNL